MVLRLIPQLIIALAMGVTLSSCDFQQNGKQGESVPEAVLQALEGNYAMKQTGPDGTHYSTAVVKEVATGQYQVNRITVYGPIVYGFTLGKDAAVKSAELGEGTITYKESIKKTTIRFQKEEFVCELSK